MNETPSAADCAETSSPWGDDLALLNDAVREGGAIALRYFGKNPNAQKKSDGTSVSEADFAVDTALRDILTRARPEYGWLSEETEDTPERLSRERVWVVDPIDGTRAFLKEKPEWTIAAALVEAGRPVVAAVYNPVREEFYHAVQDQGTWLNGAQVTASDPVPLEQCRLAASAELFRRKIWDRPWPPMTTQWVNSIAYRLALVAAGTFDGTLSLSQKSDWDLAAAELLVQEAGGRVTTNTGERLQYNSTHPRQEGVVAAGVALHGELLDRILRANF